MRPFTCQHIREAREELNDNGFEGAEHKKFINKIKKGF
jgi:hypothetical protein